MVDMTFADALKQIKEQTGLVPYYDPTNAARKYISLRKKKEQVPGLVQLNSEFWAEFTDYDSLSKHAGGETLMSQFLAPELAGRKVTEVDNWIATKSAEFQRKVELKQDQVQKVNVRLTDDDEDQEVHKFVPTLDELPQAVRDLTPSDIVTLFDEPELEMFLLWLARVLVGPNNVWPLGFNEPLAHAMRIAICIYSPAGK